jgi:hypothetical protein
MNFKLSGFLSLFREYFYMDVSSFPLVLHSPSKLFFKYEKLFGRDFANLLIHRRTRRNDTSQVLQTLRTKMTASL